MTARAWPPRLAYYTVFALPPLLVLVMTIVGFVWDPRQVEGQVEQQMAELVGQQGAGQIQTMVHEARHFGSGLAATLGVIVLIVGATGLFAQLQWSLNRVWEVQPDPAQGGLKNFIVKRILSFGMILAIAFLLLVSLIVSAILSAFGQYIANLLSGQISQTFLQVANFTISLVVIAVLFAAMFRWLPDAHRLEGRGFRSDRHDPAVSARPDPDRPLPGQYELRLGLRRRRLPGAGPHLDLLLVAHPPLGRRVHPRLGSPPRQRRAGRWRRPRRTTHDPHRQPSLNTLSALGDPTVSIGNQSDESRIASTSRPAQPLASSRLTLGPVDWRSCIRKAASPELATELDEPSNS